jgi:hypothetical protein
LAGTDSSPYFDQPRVAASQLLTEQSAKTKFVIPSGGTGERWRFFGALLDFNQTDPRFPELVTAAALNGAWPTSAKSIQQLVRGHHQCLVAEISYASDPIPEGATPASSENLAQRNLAISESANPGTAASRTVHHTFEVTQGRGGADDENEPMGEPTGPPDGLMIRWLDVPPRTRATLYLNAEAAAETIRLAAGRVGAAQLRPRGPCGIEIQSRTVTYVPLPVRRAPLPALLTLQLPDGVRSGDHYRAVLHQISGETRDIVGTFELGIPVRPASELLP